MNSSIELLLQSQPDGQLVGFLAAPGLQKSFQIDLPQQLVGKYKAWRDRYVTHHDPNGNVLPADVLDHYADQLLNGLEGWLQNPEWEPLQDALRRHDGLPLRLQIDPTLTSLERLPWECLPLKRPIWRVVQSQSPIPSCAVDRQPRVLLLVGDEHSLNLCSEVEKLEALQRQGRIALTALQGVDCNIHSIRTTLKHPQGWDALLFLGHSEADPAAGGRIHLGDGSWISAQSLEADLKQAAQDGLRLVVLNSCSGLNWAQRAVGSGVGWAVCFREVVPSYAAAFAFERLLLALERGQDLCNAIEEVRQALSDQDNKGASLLLSAIANSTATSYRLPLRKRRQLTLRLAASKAPQAIAASVFLAIGVATDLVPWNPINHGLLNQRLRLQKEYRLATNQLGPKTNPMPVLLLEKRRSLPELGVIQPTQATTTSREALKKVLEQVKPEVVPRLGIDVVLDQPGIEPKATASLATLIKQQQRAELFAGFFGAKSDDLKAGELSKPIPLLANAGLKAYDLAVNTDPGWWSTPQQRQAPLQLKAPIDGKYFSHALAGHPDSFMPADAVIDWSLDWSQLLRRVTSKELVELNGPVLLVGSEQIDPRHADLFDPPAASLLSLERWQLPTSSIPGVLVQGVFAQSLALGHWLTPLSSAACTALASGLGVLLAAAQQRRNRRLIFLSLTSLIAVIIAFQVAVSNLILVPLVLPLFALWAVALLREN